MEIDINKIKESFGVKSPGKNLVENLQFEITPCPQCGKTFTVDDVEQVEDNLFAIKHPCKGKYGTSFYCYGENLRAVVQNWNKYIKELR